MSSVYDRSHACGELCVCHLVPATCTLTIGISAVTQSPTSRLTAASPRDVVTRELRMAIESCLFCGQANARG
jgi:hypothetical protein